MKHLIAENNFFQILFNVIPVMTMVMDSDGIVYAVNDATKTTLNMLDETKLKKVGEHFNCINSTVDSKGCGHSIACTRCIIRNTGLAAVSGQTITRGKGKLDVVRPNQEIETIILLVSASAFQYNEQKYAIMVMEDISNITELSGLLPICSSCKKIRNDQGYWDQVEKYIEKHSEAEFTHGYCPECILQLFPQQAKKVNQVR